jgi:hypothetical protein
MRLTSTLLLHCSCDALRSIPYEGMLLPSDLHDQFDARYHCPTGFNAANLDYEEDGAKVRVVLLGNPMKIGPNLNSCGKTTYDLPISIKAAWKMRPADDAALLAAVAVESAKGGPIRNVSVPGDFLSINVPYDQGTKMCRTEVVIEYGDEFYKVRSTPDDDAHCDQCFAKHSEPEDRMLFCSDKTCKVGRHRCCFRRPIAKTDVAEYIHMCWNHEMAHRDALMVERANARDNKGTLLPTDNHPMHRATIPGFGRNQALLSGKKWVDGLRYNAAQLNTAVCPSTVPNSGNGLFLKRATTVNTLPVGWFWGSIVSEKRFRELIETPDVAVYNGTPEERAFCNDWENGIRRAITIADVMSDSKTEYMMLISRQCPVGCMNDSRGQRAGAACKIAWPKEGYATETNGSMSHLTFPVHTVDGAVPAGTELFFEYGWSEEEWQKAIPAATKKRDSRPAHASRDVNRPSTPAAARRGVKAREKRPDPKPRVGVPLAASSPALRIYDSPMQEVIRGSRFATHDAPGAAAARSHDGHSSDTLRMQVPLSAGVTRHGADSSSASLPRAKRTAEVALGGGATVGAAIGPSPIRPSSPDYVVMRHGRPLQPATESSSPAGHVPAASARRSLALAFEGRAAVPRLPATVLAASSSSVADVDMIDLTNDEESAIWIEIGESSAAAISSDMSDVDLTRSGASSSSAAAGAPLPVGRDAGHEHHEGFDYGEHESIEENSALDDDYQSDDSSEDDAPHHRPASTRASEATVPPDPPPAPAPSAVRYPQLRGLRKLEHLVKEDRCNLMTFGAERRTAIKALVGHYTSLSKGRTPAFNMEKFEQQYSVIKSCCGQDTLMRQMRGTDRANLYSMPVEHPFDSPEAMIKERLKSYTDKKMQGPAMRTHLLGRAPNPFTTHHDRYSIKRTYRVGSVPTCINCLTCLIGMADRWTQRQQSDIQHGNSEYLVKPAQKSGRHANLHDDVFAFILLFLGVSGLDETNPVNEGVNTRKACTQVINLPYSSKKELLRYLSDEKFRMETNMEKRADGEPIELMCSMSLFFKALQTVKTEKNMTLVTTKSKKFMRCDTCLTNDYAIKALRNQPIKRAELMEAKTAHLEQTRRERRLFEHMRDIARYDTHSEFALRISIESSSLMLARR